VILADCSGSMGVWDIPAARESAWQSPRAQRGITRMAALQQALSDLLDVAPTIADVFGVLDKGGASREFQGRSLLPVLFGAPGKPAVLSRTIWDRPRYALRDERFKYLYDTRTGDESLYDLESDPLEQHDRAAAEPLRAAYYREALARWTLALSRRAGAGAGAGPEPVYTCEQCQNLLSLGYLQGDCRAYCK